jgi:hypothetical protein
MKLIGSKQEQEFRKELVASKLTVSQDDKVNTLFKVLRALGEFKTAYILNWTPEQGDDIFTILIDLDKVAKIEISRINSSEKPVVEIFKLKDFYKGLSKVFQIKLAVAIDLAKRDLCYKNRP